MGFFPKRTETGIKNLGDIGFIPIFSKNYLRNNTYSRDSISERLEEINEILDKDVDLIIASIGGYLSIQLLKMIDYEKIKEKKITFCGFSDITALLLAIYVKTKMIMLYGPVYTVNLCDYGGIDEYTKDNFLKIYQKQNIKYVPSSYAIREFIDWKDLENKVIVKKREIKGNDWKIINSGSCLGKLIGGNLSTLMLILGTEFLPIETFDNSILFLEDCETNICEFCSYLESLKIRGVFERIKGILIGKFDTEKMNNEIEEFLNDYFADYQIPIVSNLDFGHVFPIMTIPIGALAKLDCKRKKVSLEVYFEEPVGK